MKKLIIYLLAALLGMFVLHACGNDDEPELPSPDPVTQQETEEMYQQQLEEMRRDSIEQARADSIAKAEERQQFDYSETGEYLVQVGSWRSESKAERIADEWKDKGFEYVTVEEYGNPDTGDVWFRVRIGQFDTREMADRLRRVLAEDHSAESWIAKKGQPEYDDRGEKED